MTAILRFPVFCGMFAWGIRGSTSLPYVPKTSFQASFLRPFPFHHKAAPRVLQHSRFLDQSPSTVQVHLLCLTVHIQTHMHVYIYIYIHVYICYIFRWRVSHLLKILWPRPAEASSRAGGAAFRELFRLPGHKRRVRELPVALELFEVYLRYVTVQLCKECGAIILVIL